MSDTRTWRSPLFWSSQKWNYAQNLTPYQNNLSLQPLETYFSSLRKVIRRPSSCPSSLNLPLYILINSVFFLNYFWILTEEGWGHSQARAGRMSHRRIFLGLVVWKFHFCEILELFNILFITVISLLSGPFRSGPTLK